MNKCTLFNCARRCLIEPHVEQTLSLTETAVADLNQGVLSLEQQDNEEDLYPVFPDKPRLVDVNDLPRRGTGTELGRAALVHAIAHIEYNAVHLAWDAVWRFRGLPEGFYRDWTQVAGEEARHFRLLQVRLYELGYEYGDFDAHDGLWRVAHATGHDPLVRMALVPRVLEARGLDVTPGMITKFQKAGDTATADILKIIYTEEIGHVQIGTRWFHYLCEQRGLQPESTFYRLVDEFYEDGLRGPYNEEARSQAGFSASELNWLRIR